MTSIHDAFRDALFEAREARSALLSAREDGTSSNADLARQFFTKMAEVYRIYSDPQNWPARRLNDNDFPEWDYGTPVVTLPLDMTYAIGGLLGHIGAGHLPEPIADAIKAPGRVARVPGEVRDIKIALAYIRLARDRAVEDFSPIQTIAAAYAVSRRTVEKWQKTYAADTSWPAIHASDDNIVDRMTDAAERYKQSGRGAAAVAARANANRKV